MWPLQHHQTLLEKISVIIKDGRGNYCFLNPRVIDGDYSEGVFNPFYFSDNNSIIGSQWIQQSVEQSYSSPCVYIITAHGSDLTDTIWNLRASAHPSSVFCLWHFDNHVAYFNNYKSAISADINFISHNNNVPGYLTNPLSPIAAHIPLCCVQFGINEIHQEIYKTFDQPRSNKGLFNYIVYEDAPRAKLMNQWKIELGELAEFKLMPSSDRTRYWSLSRPERFKEWADYKCSVIVPLVQDLSTRVFDSLATGQIPIIPDEIRDFDIICSREQQKKLGIVRIPELSTAAIAEGIAQAVNNFDTLGEQGVLARSEYVVNQCMLGHRLLAILDVVKAIGTGSAQLVFGKGPNGIASYLNQ